MYVTNFSQKLLDRIAWDFQGWFDHHPRTNRLDFGSDQVKGQGPGHEKVKNITRYFCPIHMKPMPKCSLFNSLSSDMLTNVALAKVCALPSGLYVCMYVFYQLFSKTTGPNCMKFSGMICHHPRTNRLDFGSDQVKGQGQQKGQESSLFKTTPTELHEIFRDGFCHHPMVTNWLDFGSRSGQRSKPRSRKGLKTYFCHNTAQFSSDSYETNAKMFTFQFPILWYGQCVLVGEGMHSNDWVCMYVTSLFSKTTGPNCMKFSGMICHHPRTNRLDFGSDQVKGQGPGHKKVKNVFLS